MKFKPVVWFLLACISAVCAHVGMDDGNLLVLFVIVVGIFLLSFAMVGLVVLVAKLFERSPGLLTRRWVFLSMWGLATFGQLCRQL
jgi:hypothetical protein